MTEHGGEPVDEELEALLDHDEALLGTASEVHTVLHEAEIEPEFMRGLR